jgi:hypothetical protein
MKRGGLDSTVGSLWSRSRAMRSSRVRRQEKIRSSPAHGRNPYWVKSHLLAFIIGFKEDNVAMERTR